MFCIQFELVSADVKLNPFNPDPVVGRAIVSSAEEVSTMAVTLIIACSEM
jgi:hypothetical protein